MIGPFVYEDGAYRARLTAPHTTLFIQLVREILVVLDEPAELSSVVSATTGLETRRDIPEERALEHLLPPMSLDPDDASSLRAMTEDFLRAEKSSRLRRAQLMLEKCEHLDLGEITISEDEVWEWLGALNDVRLGLAGELSLQTDEDVVRIEELAGQAPVGTHEQSAAAIYMIITWWQDSLISTLNS